MGRYVARMVIGFLALVAMATAQESKESGDAPFDIGEQVLEPGSSNYPAELATTGAQGSVKIQSKVAVDGRLVEAQVATSSNSAQLDELAIGYVNKLRIKSPAEVHGAQEVVVQVTFTRDTTFTILKKTCAEFNTDLAFARGLDPAATASNLRGYKLAQGIVMFARNRSSNEIGVMAKNFKIAPAAIEAACAAQPDANFAKTLEEVITAK